MEQREIAIRITGVKKQYRLGQIGGGTLNGALQSRWARFLGKEDPNTPVSGNMRSNGQTFLALDGIDLTVYKGEALGIIGSNGAGKSTLLKLLSRVTAPTEGEIDLYGRVTSMLEVGTGFHGEMTGRENIYMNGAILGMSREETDEKMEDIIAFSEVGEFIDTPVKRYSSGMYVKLAFAVAAHLDSEIMILDEVLAVGDMAFQQKCLGKMGEAAGKEGKTLLYVSHNMNTIRQLCTRCIVLHHGRIVYDGDVEEAIRVYMDSRADTFRDRVELREKARADALYARKVKMCAFTFENPGGADLKPGSPISFCLEVDSTRRREALCLRTMVYFSDGTQVAMASSRKGDILLEQGRSFLRGRVDTGCLAPGTYSLKLALYRVNDFGGEERLDVVDGAVHFRIGEEQVTNRMTWSHKWWGHIRLRDIEME